MKRYIVLIWCLGLCAQDISLANIHSSSEALKHDRSWDADAIKDLISMLSISSGDTFGVISDDAQLITQLYQASPAHHMIVTVPKPLLCDVIQKQSATLQQTQDKTSQKSIDVICKKLEAISWENITTIFLHLPEDTSTTSLQKLSTRLAQLPNGTRIAATIPLDDNLPSLRFERTQSIMPHTDEDLLIHLYIVKEPTPAELLEEIYCGVNGFSIGSGESDIICKSGGNATYGEIPFESAEKLFTEIITVSSNDVFYDLGCGVGKLVEWIYLATPAKKSVGIELSKTRFKHAEDLAKKVRSDLVPLMKPSWIHNWGDSALKKTVSFRHENILESDISDATIIFVCATCFPEACMGSLTEMFAKLNEGTRIISLKEFPAHPHIHRVGSVNLKMTWSRERGSEVFLYTVQKPRLVDAIDHAKVAVSAGTCTLATEDEIIDQFETTQDAYEHDAAQRLYNALDITAETLYLQLGVYDGVNLAQAMLLSPAAIIRGVTSSPNDKARAESLIDNLIDELKQDPYKTLYKQHAKDSSLQCAPKIMLDSSLNIAAIIDAIGSTIPYKKIAVVINGSTADQKAWENFTQQCIHLPRGTRIATVQELKASQLLSQGKIKLTVQNGDVRILHLYEVGTQESLSKDQKNLDTSKSKKSKNQSSKKGSQKSS